MKILIIPVIAITILTFFVNSAFAQSDVKEAKQDTVKGYVRTTPCIPVPVKCINENVDYTKKPTYTGRVLVNSFTPIFDKPDWICSKQIGLASKDFVTIISKANCQHYFVKDDNKEGYIFVEFIRMNYDDYEEAVKLYGMTSAESLANKIIRIGVAEKYVKLIYGEPDKINSTETAGGTSNQYIYENRNQYIYTEKGFVTAIQSSINNKAK